MGNNNGKNDKSSSFTYNSSNNFGFEDLSFKEVYKDNPLFEHIISKINEKLSSSEKKKYKGKNIQQLETISEFINKNQFTKEILECIIINGIPDDLPSFRPLIWRSMIGYLKLDDLSKWRQKIKDSYKKYQQIKREYNISLSQIKEEEDEKILQQIDKDLPRTRTELPFFQQKTKIDNTETNYDVLRRILFYYSKIHPQVNYVQGMNEIIAIIYYIFAIDDNPFIAPYIESDSYFCFELLMEEIKDIFLMNDISYSQLFISLQIKKIKEILKSIDLELMNYLNENEVIIDNFVMRWILCLFAQEFSMSVEVKFWDRLFTQKDKMRFLCIIICAILISNKGKIMKMDMEEIMLWAQDFGKSINNNSLNEIVLCSYDIKEKLKKIGIKD